MSIKSLPPMEHTFSIKVKGSETKQNFEGTFTYKRPNLRVQSEVSKTKAILDGGMKNLDENTQYLHKVLADLKHTLIKYPDWWVDSDYGYELYDLNVILDIYKECSKFEKKWLDQVWSEEDEQKGQSKKS